MENLNPEVVTYWPNSLEDQAPLTIDSLIDYQKLKFNKIETVIKKHYYRLNTTEREDYPFYSTIESFHESANTKGFVTAIIIKIDQKKDQIKLTLMDKSGVYQVLSKEEQMESCSLLITGLHLGFKLSKEDEKYNSNKQKNTISNLVSQITKSTPTRLQGYIWPDLEVETPWKNTGSSKVVVISDIHCGNITFLVENFSQLIDKINKENSIKYLILNGDLADGINVYPLHTEDLNIKTFYQQYHRLCSLLGTLRSDITIIASPGNHDMVRKVEPQFFPENVKDIFRKYIKNIIFLSNPGYLQIEGVYFYLTHGTSYNSILNAVPSLDSTKCVDITEYLCKVRNISPIRNAVPIKSNTQLYHLIPDKVNVICSGHMHNQGVKIYKGRLLVSTGAWQHQTPYMKLLGISASIAQGVCIDLSDINNYQKYELQDETSNRHTYHRAIVEKIT